MNPCKYDRYDMSGTLRWPYNNMQKELGPYELVGVNANQSRVGDLTWDLTCWFIGVLLTWIGVSFFLASTPYVEQRSDELPLATCHLQHA